jgi:hypothetical protein
MRAGLRDRVIFFPALVLLLVNACAVWADVGPPSPEPRREFIFHVMKAGQPLFGDIAAVLLLTPKPERVGLEGEYPEWLKRDLLTDSDGTQWFPAYQRAGNGGMVEIVESRRPGPRGWVTLPENFRLAVFVPGEKVFLSRPSTARFRNRNVFLVDLQAEGEATVVPVSALSPLFWQAYAGPILLAGAATLAVELCVALAWVPFLVRQPPRPVLRIALICLAANLVLVPLVFGVGLALRTEVLDYPTSLGVFLGLQVLAVAVQAALYVWVGKLSTWGSVGLSTSANLASVVIGCCTVSVPGWYL